MDQKGERERDKGVLVVGASNQGGGICPSLVAFPVVRFTHSSLFPTNPGHDFRYGSEPRFRMVGHALAVRKVACNPHRAGGFASAGYDRLTCVWQGPTAARVHPPAGAAEARSHAPAAVHVGLFACGPPLHVFQGHTEFATGVDFDLHSPRLADCGWDGMVQVYALSTR